MHMVCKAGASALVDHVGGRRERFVFRGTETKSLMGAGRGVPTCGRNKKQEMLPSAVVMGG